MFFLLSSSIKKFLTNFFCCLSLKPISANTGIIKYVNINKKLMPDVEKEEEKDAKFAD